MTASITRAIPSRAGNSLESIIELRSRLLNYCKSALDKGRQHHAKGLLDKAIFCFLEAVQLSYGLTSNNHTSHENPFAGIEMYYTASHNLASCYNQQNDWLRAEIILRNCHEKIISLAEDTNKSRELRLESLCVLKRSLFSLASQLAFMNKPSEIHELINHTETIADNLQQALGINAN